MAMMLPCALVLLSAGATDPPGLPNRATVSINFGWRFAPDPDGPAHGGDAHGPAVNSTAPAADAEQAQPAFDDSAWAVVDIPHDASVTGDYASTENGGEGFLPLARTWYRKKISVPQSWSTRTVTLVVDAALSTTTWYLNGKQLLVQNPVGYLPTVLGLEVKVGADNVLACYVDGGLTTGWWYEGSGLIRSARLIATSTSAAVAPFGISSPSFAQGKIMPNGPKTSDGLLAPLAIMSPTATLVGAQADSATVQFTLIDSEGAQVATTFDTDVLATADAPSSASCANSTFKFSATGLDCDGLTSTKAGDSSAAECEHVCCVNTKCDIWQWAKGGGAADGCWTGKASCSTSPKPSHAKWTGGARTKPSGGGHPSGGGGGGSGGPIKSAVMRLSNIQLWSVARPYLYTLRVDVTVDGKVTDSMNQSVGIRNLAWDAEQGLKVNEQPVKMRGACNHESFTGVGAALPDRVDLLRVQQMRGVGMNAWRSSHNPPEPVLLDIADRLGILVLDENRVLATDVNCQGRDCKDVPYYAGDPAVDMGNLAKRDRNHPSVAWYSLCNEAGCGNGTLLAGDLVEHAKEATCESHYRATALAMLICQFFSQLSLTYTE
eukprot:COSAG05_NODE_414_length_10051_cov_120.012158_4_plen_605_part_00